MKTRTTMFIVLLTAGLLCPALGPAQTTTITLPTLAPPLPPAVAAEAAAATPIPAADRLTLRQRREMGFTRLDVIRAATRLAREGALPSTVGLEGADLEAATAEIKDAVAAEILGDNIEAWGANVQDGNDWGQFFEQLIAFLEKLMPLILKLIEMFGAFSSAAPVSAGAIAHASPLLFLAV